MAYNDRRIRNDLPASCRALLDAYESGTKRTLHLDHMRVGFLHALAMRDITAADMHIMITYVRRRIRAGDNKKGIGFFREASLEFANLCGDTGKFCDRLHTAKLEISNAKARRQKQLAPSTVRDGASTITRIVEAPLRAAEPVRAVLAGLLRGIAAEVEAA